MAKVRYLVAIACVVALTVMNATAGMFTVPVWIEKSCVFVMNGDKAEGTGFLLGVSESGKTFFYFVTARHVIQPALSNAKTLQLRLNKRGEDKAEIVDFPLFYFLGKPWIEHTNPAIDLAVTPLAIGKKLFEYDVHIYVADSETNDFFACQSFLAKYKVRPGDQAFSLGLVTCLFNLNKDARNLIMARSGTVSMLAGPELQLPGGRQKAHFLDCAAFDGQSGGPAFVLLDRSESGGLVAGWRIALLGVVTEFMPRPLRAKKVTLAEQERREAIVPIENTGITKVVPIDYLVEILFSKEQKQFRKQVMESQEKPSNKSAPDEGK